MANVVLNAGDYTRINSQLFVSGTIHEESGHIRLITPSGSAYPQNTALELNSELSSIVGCVQTNDYWGIRGWYYDNGSGVNHGYVEIATNTSNDTSIAGEIRCAQYTGGTPIDGTGVNRATAWILDASSNTVFPNQVWGGGFFVNSSREKKENIKLSQLDAEALLLETPIYEFNYKEDATKKQKIGIISEESDPLLTTDEKDGMDVTNCVGILLKAVQSLIKRVEELEKVVSS